MSARTWIIQHTETGEWVFQTDDVDYPRARFKDSIALAEHFATAMDTIDGLQRILRNQFSRGVLLKVSLFPCHCGA